MKLVPLIICTFILAACTSRSIVVTNVQPDIRNPASVYCHDKDGKLSLIKSKEGVTGYCTLPSGELVEEWELYHRDHSGPSR